MRRTALIILVLAVTAPAALATGFMVPADPSLPGLQLESHRVTVRITDQGALTSVQEVFRNQHKRDLEAIFVFPLPRNAVVSDFKMYLNGKLVTGEMMDADKARATYENIVRQMRDPGLLEFIDSRLLRLRVFPVPAGGTQEVTLKYSEALRAEDGLVEYVYPLKTGDAAAKTLKDFTLSVDISSQQAIKNVYSPTHDVAIKRIDDHRVSAGFEKTQAELDRNFQLFYALSDADFGASLISSKPNGKDGYFLLLLSPKVDVEESEVSAKDVVFVIDTSGSMKGEKISQARNALEFCVSSLASSDRFRIITFSNAVEERSEDLLEATPANVAKAREHIKGLNAAGGTDIHSALTTALKSVAEASRTLLVVFLTDGLPTVGQTDVGRIIGDVEKANSANARIFSFGVGYDVNAQLLDRLAQTANGVNQYVEPEESIEVKVSSFFKKIGQPLLRDIEIDYGTAGVHDIYPAKPADLFRGSQLVIAGRYRNGGAASLTLKGRGAGGEVVLEYAVDFASGATPEEFVTNVWAGRKIAFLLREIRLHGENAELKSEVIRLSNEYGIMTPYTSYLITEGTPVVTNAPMPIQLRLSRRYEHARPLDINGDAVVGTTISRDEAERLRSLGYIGDGGQPAAAAYKAGAFTSGPTAVRASAASKALAEKAQADQGRLIRRVGRHNFANIGGSWVDQDVKKDSTVVQVKFASKAYFEIFNKAVKLQKTFALGEKLVVQVGDYCLEIDDEGIEDATDASVLSLIKAAQKL